MRIINRIKYHLDNQVNDGLIEESIYTYAAQFNNISGRCKTPTGVLLIPDEWKLECDTVTAREHGIFNLYYLTAQPQLDFDALNNETLIDGMIDIAVDMIGRLKQDTTLAIENIDFGCKSMYDVNNKNLTGVLLRLNVKENQGRCIPDNRRCF